jgi:Ran GTPase-activating protein (RanGAP) involved in mRNA processing and transport
MPLDNEMIEVLEGFRDNKNPLEKLVLRWRNISDKDAPLLADVIKNNTTLEKLDLQDNQLSNKGGIILAQALEKNTTLKKLYLGKNQISDEGAAGLAQVLEMNTTLQELQLEQNPISTKGAARLAQALEKNSTLKSLCLFNDRLIGSEPIQQVYNLIDRNKRKFFKAAQSAKEAKPVEISEQSEVQSATRAGLGLSNIRE